MLQLSRRDNESLTVGDVKLTVVRASEGIGTLLIEQPGVPFEIVSIASSQTHDLADNVTLVVRRASGGLLKLGIDAPRHVLIFRCDYEPVAV